MELLDSLTVSSVYSASAAHQPTGAEFSMTKRALFGLSFSLGGRITYTQNGKDFVCDTDHAIIHPHGSTYTFKCDKGGDFPLINFHTSEHFTDEFIVLPISNKEELIKRYEALKEAMMRGSRPKVMSIFYDILALLSENSIPPESSVLAPAMKYLHAKLTTENVTNAHLAQISHVSESYFRRLFRQSFGTSPRQYIINARLQLAKQLLGECRHTVGEIAEACGFSSVYHFCRTFKDSVGETPLAYAKKYRTSSL